MVWTFGFELMQSDQEYFYTVGVENHAFEMHIDENGIWKIKGKVPIWLQDLEENLGETIEQKNI